MDVPRPARTVNPTAKLKDSANTEVAQLSFQRKAVQDFHSRQTVKNNSGPASLTVVNPPAPSVNVESTPQSKRNFSSINGGDVEDGIVDQPAPRMSCFHLTFMFSLKCIFTIAKKKHATATTSQAKSKGMTSVTVGTIDVDMLDAEENIPAKGMIFPNHDS